MTIAAVVEERAVAATVGKIEDPRVVRVVLVVRVVRVVRVERTGPVEAAGANADEASANAPPGSREENVAVRITGLVAGNLVTGYTVKLYVAAVIPCPCAVITQFILFSLGGHAPTAAPLDLGNVIFGVKGGLGICETIITITTYVQYLVIVLSEPLHHLYVDQL